MIDMREICKPVLKLDCTADSIIETFSEFGPSSAHGAEIDSGDLTPYLTYGLSPRFSGRI
jgi:hypothetical protein